MAKKTQENQMFRDLRLFQERGNIAIIGLIKILKSNRWVAKRIARETFKKIDNIEKKYGYC